MNAHSSRSHAIFTVLLEQRIRPEGLSPVADDKVQLCERRVVISRV